LITQIITKAGPDAAVLPISGILADAPLNTQQIIVAGNDSTRFSVERRKAGVTTIKDTMVYTPLDKVVNLSFSL
jgi:hypothetical protein